MKVAKVRAKLKTFGTVDVKHTHYATTLVLLEWQTEHFILTLLHSFISHIVRKYTYPKWLQNYP